MYISPFRKGQKVVIRSNEGRPDVVAEFVHGPFRHPDAPTGQFVYEVYLPDATIFGTQMVAVDVEQVSALEWDYKVRL